MDKDKEEAKTREDVEPIEPNAAAPLDKEAKKDDEEAGRSSDQKDETMHGKDKRDKDRKRKKEKHEERSRSVSRERKKDRKKERGSRSRSRSRDKRRSRYSSHSRSPPRDQRQKERARYRSSSREADRDVDRRRRSVSRSPSRDEPSYRRRRSTSRDRGGYRRSRHIDYSRSRSRSRSRGRRYRRSSSPGYGYVPRAAHRPSGPQAQAKPLYNEFGVIGVSNQAASAPKVTSDPRMAAALVAAAAAPPSSLLPSPLLNPSSIPSSIQAAAGASYPLDTEAMQKLIAEQQLRSQQLALQQQLAAMTAANNAKILKEQRAARRIYVGNMVPGMVTEDHLKAIFNSALQAAFPGSSLPGMEPVVGITKPTDGRFYFIEMRTPEMATAAMQLHQQVTLHGRVMNVQRPVDYVAPTAFPPPM